MHATINVRLTVSIDDGKTIPLATLAEFITDQNIESVLLEGLVESLEHHSRLRCEFSPTKRPGLPLSTTARSGRVCVRLFFKWPGTAVQTGVPTARRRGRGGPSDIAPIQIHFGGEKIGFVATDVAGDQVLGQFLDVERHPVVGDFDV